MGVAKTDSNNIWQFMGLIALYDRPKKSSKKTIADAKSMGIDVKMITGDHIAIAKRDSQRIRFKYKYYVAYHIFRSTRR